MQTDTLPISTITPGSSLYYALLYTPKPEQAAIALLMHFFDEIKSIASNVSELSVAKTKLLWWSKEIAQTYKHYPQHPLSHALSNVIQQYALPEREYQRYIQAIINSLEEAPLAIQDKINSYRDECGAKLFLLSSITTYNLPPEEFISHLSIALQTIDDIRHIGREIKKHPELYAPENNDQLRDSLKNLTFLAKTHYEQALGALNANQREKQLSWIIFANIQFALLAEIEKLNFHILDKKLSLTPLRKLWVAWRTKRREKKIIKKLYTQAQEN